MFHYKILLISVVSFTHLQASDNIVCSNFVDYFFPESNPNCWHNPDLDADIFKILSKRNMSLEVYKLESEDGYILSLFRVRRENPKGIVYLVHPMSQTSLVWFNHENRSLGFQLYNAGYEVWLSNLRGSYYSRTHTVYSSRNFNYWNFSFHEIGKYDVPLEIDKIKNVTGRSDIIYIGYSLSTTSALVYGSLYPQHSRNSVKIFIFIGPIIYLGFDRFHELFSKPLFRYIWPATKLIRVGTVLPSFTMTQKLTKQFCAKAKAFSIFCLWFLEGKLGNLQNIDASLAVFTYSHFLTRIPIKTLHHYYQINQTRRFQMYDYGKKKNLIAYRSEIPPLYPIENLVVPIFMIHGGRDRSGTLPNTEEFYRELPNRVKKYGKLFIPEFSHLDFIISKQYGAKVTEPIKKLLDDIGTKRRG